MTVETAIAKLMIGIGRYGAGAELRAYLESNVIGERTISPENQARASGPTP